MNYRCDTCGHRRSGSWKREQRCCGQRMRNDTRNVRRWNARQIRCDCGQIEFPHRAGSLYGGHLCIEHPRFSPWG